MSLLGNLRILGMAMRVFLNMNEDENRTPRWSHMSE